MGKNLVKVNRFYEHPYYVESGSENIYVVERLTPEDGVYQISGPAIDRLYEFEKLGMEPEEIQKLRLENVDLFRKHYDDRKVKEDYDALVKSTNELNECYKSLESRTINLKICNEKLEEENKKLRSEIEMNNQLFKSKSKIIDKKTDK